MKAVYVQRGESIDYTPTSASVSAGDVVAISATGPLFGIAKLDIAKDELGALALKGIYDIAKLKDDVVAVGAIVYWDADAGTATVTEGALKRIGVAVAASVKADTIVRVLLNA